MWWLQVVVFIIVLVNVVTASGGIYNWLMWWLQVVVFIIVLVNVVTASGWYL